MEPISEERQRKVYEWMRPHLKGTDWWIALKNGLLFLPALYVSGPGRTWQPNYQWFFTEVVPKLVQQKVLVYYEALERSKVVLVPIHGEDVFENADPNAALSEYVEVSGEA